MAQVLSKDDGTRVEERQQQILDAATTTIARKGYHAATMDDIVRESGLSKGTLYWYFKSKKEILLALADRFAAQDRAYIAEAIADKTTFADRLRAIMNTLTAQSPGCEDEDNESDPPRQLMVEMWQQSLIDPDVKARLRAGYEFWLNFTQEQIEQAIITGEIRPVDTQALASMIVGLYDGLSWQYQFNLQPATNQENLTRLVDILLAGLLPVEAQA